MLSETTNRISIRSFNRSEGPANSTKYLFEKLVELFQTLLKSASKQSWPVLVWNVLLWLGALSIAWRVLMFPIRNKLTRVLVRIVGRMLSFMKTSVTHVVKSSDRYQKKQLIPPRFNNGDNIYGWLNTFERHAQDLSDLSKRRILLQLLNGDSLEKLQH